MPFDAYTRYYDLIYHDKDYEAEVDYIVDLLLSNGVTGHQILEFGSGTGKHGRLLAQRGYQVTGIERSAQMLSLSKQVPGFVCQQGDICNVDLGHTFDAVISLFHVISYQLTNKSVSSVFANAAEHLSTGGLFIFDVWYSPAVLTQRPVVRVKRFQDEKVCFTRIAEPTLYPNQNRVDVNYTIFAEDLLNGAIDTLSECHPMRHFSILELDHFANNVGLDLLSSEEFLTGESPSEETWGICLVFKKR